MTGKLRRPKLILRQKTYAMKALINQIRKAKTWREQVSIAENLKPGTAFDHVFAEAKLAKNMEAWGHHGNARHVYETLGRALVDVIIKGNVSKLQSLARALAIWKRHTPKPDYDLVVLCSMSGMFPPGWTKTVANFDETGQVIRDPKTGSPVLGAKPGTRDKIAMRDLKKNLKRIDPNFDEDQWDTRRRRLQRYARQLKIPLDDTPGRPSKKLRQL